MYWFNRNTVSFANWEAKRHREEKALLDFDGVHPMCSRIACVIVSQLYASKRTASYLENVACSEDIITPIHSGSTESNTHLLHYSLSPSPRLSGLRTFFAIVCTFNTVLPSHFSSTFHTPDDYHGNYTHSRPLGVMDQPERGRRRREIRDTTDNAMDQETSQRPIPIQRLTAHFLSPSPRPQHPHRHRHDQRVPQ